MLAREVRDAGETNIGLGSDDDIHSRAALRHDDRNGAWHVLLEGGHASARLRE